MMVEITIAMNAMPIQIADPAVVAKIERLAAVSGLSKTAAVEKAVDAMLAARRESRNARRDGPFRPFWRSSIELPERPDAFDPLDWDRKRIAAVMAADTSTIVAIIQGELERATLGLPFISRRKF